MSDVKKLVIRGTTLLIIVLFCISTVSHLLIPNRNELPFNPTTKVRGFYDVPKDSLDIVFIGSSNMFSTICPAVLWDEQGVTSYVMGANEQNWELSYYYIKEVLKYQQPQAIVLDAYYCAFDTHQRVPVIRINLDDLKFSLNKLSAVVHTTRPQYWFSFIFPIVEYHERWKDIGIEKKTPKVHYEFKGWSPIGEKTHFKKDNELWSNGIEYKNISPYVDIHEEELPAQCIEWLEQMSTLCQENNVELIVMLTPNDNKICIPKNGGEEYEQINGEAYYKSLEKVTADRGITFVNLNSSMEGLYHNETTIACRATSLFGRWYSSNRTVFDKRGTEEYSDWDDCVEHVYEYLKQ